MDLSDKEASAAEYALGILDAEARRGVKQDSKLQTVTDAWEQRLAPLSEGGPEIEPPGQIWNSIIAEIDRDEASLTGTSTIRVSEGEWRAMQPGIERKILTVDNESRMMSFLIRFEPGALMPGHDHTKLEECYVIEGDLIIGSAALNAGDYHFVSPGAPHPDLTTAKGCLLFIRGEIREAA